MEWLAPMGLAAVALARPALEVERVVAVRGSSVGLATITQVDRTDASVAAAVVDAIAE